MSSTVPTAEAYPAWRSRSRIETPSPWPIADGRSISTQMHRVQSGTVATGGVLVESLPGQPLSNCPECRFQEPGSWRDGPLRVPHVVLDRQCQLRAYRSVHRLRPRVHTGVTHSETTWFFRLPFGRRRDENLASSVQQAQYALNETVRDISDRSAASYFSDAHQSREAGGMAAPPRIAQSVRTAGTEG